MAEIKIFSSFDELSQSGLEKIVRVYKAVFDGYTPGEVHREEDVAIRIKHDLELGAAAMLLTMEEGEECHGVMWAWMGLAKDRFIDEVILHSQLAVEDNQKKMIATEVKSGLGGQDFAWDYTVYVPEIAILEQDRAKGYYQQMVGTMADRMREHGSDQFVFWVQQDQRAYHLFQITLGAKLVAELTGGRALMYGDSRAVQARYGSVKNAVAV